MRGRKVVFSAVPCAGGGRPEASADSEGRESLSETHVVLSTPCPHVSRRPVSLAPLSPCALCWRCYCSASCLRQELRVLGRPLSFHSLTSPPPDAVGLSSKGGIHPTSPFRLPVGSAAGPSHTISSFSFSFIPRNCLFDHIANLPEISKTTTTKTQAPTEQNSHF